MRLIRNTNNYYGNKTNKVSTFQSNGKQNVVGKYIYVHDGSNNHVVKLLCFVLRNTLFIILYVSIDLGSKKFL